MKIIKQSGLGRFSEKKALSFVEIMIAVLLLGLMIVPISNFFNRGTTGTIQTRDEVLAYHYADELLAWLQSKNYDDLELAPATSKSVPTITLTSGGLSIQDSIETDRFTRSVTIKEITIGSNWPYIYKVLGVEVAWKSGNVARKIHMSSMVYK
ncbi:MAG: hypothetical protein HQM08_15610 [Candidatus Riflebacteria bacterium]|nr:hypothetical protein [Candidatus Riflebacteria bacterium]